jgi:hypothetical protein
MPTFTPIISSYNYNPNVASNNSWITISNDDNRPLFALATFNVNVNRSCELVVDTNLHTGNYVKITTITATVFTTLVGSLSAGTTISGVTFPANMSIDFPVTSFRLQSGSVLAYK